MSKIIYLKNKIQVNIGDKLDINGITSTITEEFIEDNKDLFEIQEDKPEYVKCIHKEHKHVKCGEIFKVIDYSNKKSIEVLNKIGNHIYLYATSVEPTTKEEYDKYCLLEEAKEKFPVGTKFKLIQAPHITVTIEEEDEFLVAKDGSISTSIKSKEGYYKVIYNTYNDVWATKLEPLLKTEDGIDIYEGDSYWFVNKKTFHIEYSKHASNRCPSEKSLMYFSTKENAQKYINSNKVVGTYQDGSPIYANSDVWIVIDNTIYTGSWDLECYKGSDLASVCNLECYCKTEAEAKEYRYNYEPIYNRSEILELEAKLPDRHWKMIKEELNLD